MAFLIGGANSAADTGYDVANSCRFQDSDSSEMSRAIASTGSNTTWTVSAWVKRVELGQSSPIFGTGDGGANNDARMVFFDAADAIECSYYNSGYTYEVTTNRVFKDISAWYHVCILFDTTESTEADRIKIYVNGTQETSFATSSYPSEDAAFNFGNTSYTHYVNDMGGRNIRGSHYIAELVYIDGTASAVTNFGEFDSDSPTIWKPKDVSGLSVGTNGVYLDFEASDNLGNAVDGGTDFTEANLDAQNQMTDSPTNNACTMNPLDNYYGAQTYSEGNLQIVSPSGNAAAPHSTFGLTSGRWYAEAKMSAQGADQTLIGISSNAATETDFHLGKGATSYGMYSGSGSWYTNYGSANSYGVAWTTNDIIGVYLDLTSNKLYFAKNGTIMNSGTGIDITDPASTELGVYFFSAMQWDNATSATWEWNFGGGSVSAISSGNTDANGYGNYEYDPSDGGSSSFDSAAKDFLAVNSKNLGSDGG